MSSTPTQAYSDLIETKQLLNIPAVDTTQDNTVNVSRNAADNYINTQIDLHELIPLPAIPPALVSMASQLATSFYNYFQSPDKTNPLKDVQFWQKNVLDYILAKYARKNPNGLAGGQTFGKTSAITGKTR